MPRNDHPLDIPPRVFISYARADGEDPARVLRQRLATEQPEIGVWHDRTRLEAGVGWWKQITEALDQVELMIMVMTPAAMASETARKEWRYARQQGVRVCPVKVSASAQLDFEALPTWMRKAYFYDLDKEWDTFVAFLKSARRENRVPFMAPDLRDDFVERPREFAALVDILLDQGHANPVAITTALKGSGGFGKTTLAIALCHHEDIVVAFDDGILWATLGQKPNVQQELTKLYAALTGERPPFVDAEDAAIQLAGRLEDRHCLIVIDDVWDPEHAKPFLRGGKRCGRLITTRLLPVVTELSANHVFVDEMTGDQSVQMLVSRLRAVPDELAPLRALAHRLGEWPILLKLAASQIRDRCERGDTLEGAIAYVNDALNKRGGVAFDAAIPSARDKAVETTVGASLDVIRADDRRRCVELSVFPQNAPIPLAALAALWGTDRFETEETAQQLDGAALVDFDLKTASIRIHDVLQSHLLSKIGDEKAVHSRLVRVGWPDRYRLPDAYAWRWIGWHLAKAGEHAELRSRLSDFRWLQAKLGATDVEALLQDFDRDRAFDDLRPVRDALRLGSNGLSQDAQQLAGQLRGRLARGVSAAIDDLLDQAEAGATRPWLTPSHASLTRPGGAVIGIFKGHTKSVEALAWSRDGRHAVSGSGDWTIRVWDLDAGRATRVLEGHAGLVSSVALTHDGRRIVSGSEDRTIRIWNLERGEKEAELRGYYGAITGVALSPNGALVASVSDDGMARVWDLQTKQQKMALKGDSHQLRAIAFTSDSHHIVLGAGDWSILTVDVENGNPGQIFVGHEGIVMAVVATEDGRRLVSGSADGTLRVWSIDTGETIHILRGHLDEVDAVAVAADGRLAVSGSRDATLRLWNLETGEMLRVMEGHSSFVRSVAVTAAGDEVISASRDRTVRHWRPALAPTHGSVTTHAESVSFLSLAANGSRAVSGSRTGALHVWDANQGQVLGILGITEGHDDYISSLRVSSDGRIAVTGSRDKTLRVWDLESHSIARVLAGHTREIRRLELSADGSRMVSMSKDRTLRFWDVRGGRALRELVSSDNERRLDTLRAGSALLLELEAEPVLSLAKNPIGTDGEMALSSTAQTVVYGLNGRLTAWNLETGATLDEDLGDFDIVALAIDPGGGRVIAGSRFGLLNVWDLKERKVVGTLKGHEGSILDIVFSPDGRSAVTASSDDTIRGWDLQSGRLRGVSPGRSGGADTVAIAPDGLIAYSVYSDTVVAYRLFEQTRLGSLSLDHRITALAVAPDGRRLALGDESGQVHFLRVEA